LVSGGSTGRTALSEASLRGSKCKGGLAEPAFAPSAADARRSSERASRRHGLMWWWAPSQLLGILGTQNSSNSDMLLVVD